MTELFERFSSKENLKLAYRYVQSELLRSNLSVNPINYPALTAIDALGDQFFTALEKYLRDDKYAPEKGFFVYIPKDNLGLRPVCILSMIDRIIYQAIFNQKILGSKVDAQLSEKLCFSNRVNDDEDAPDFIAPYFNDWKAFSTAQEEAFKKGLVWKLEIDVQQYYEHIPISELIEKLRNDFDIKDEKILYLLKKQLCTWVEYPELPQGIPQGPDSSAVLGNVYLSSLDAHVEKKFIGENLSYFRYADDIVLMGRTKEDILKTIEDIVAFLREKNLNLNEKTKLTKLADTSTIEAMRIASDYDLNDLEIPDDEFKLVQKQVPDIVQKIIKGEKIDKLSLQKLKQYLQRSPEYDLSLMLNLIRVIPLHPSLTILIVRYVGDGGSLVRDFDTKENIDRLDKALWNAYKDIEVSKWSKFWLFKLIASNQEILTTETKDEMHRILTSKDATIFKIICLYYQAIKGEQLDVEIVKNTIQESESETEKALYFFFLSHAFNDTRTSIIHNHIEQALNSTSQEINLIGCYLSQKNPQAVDDIEGSFSLYLLGRVIEDGKMPLKEPRNQPTPQRYIVYSEDLMPYPDIIGVRRVRKKRRLIELPLPEIVKWEKVALRIKEGREEVEILYDGRLMKTAGYFELGLYSGEKQKKPNRLWGFLCALALLSDKDFQEATPNNMRSMITPNLKTRSTENIHRIKSDFVKELQDIFKTTAEPFHDRRDCYQPKFALLPEPALRGDIWSTRLRTGKSQEPNFFEDENLALDEIDDEAS